MYIEFTLPDVPGAPSQGWVNMMLTHELDNWAQQYNIIYKTKIFKNTKRVTFENEQDYSFFAMTWNPKPQSFRDYLANYRLIEPMSRV